MNTDNYNKAIDKLVFYRRKAELAKLGTSERCAYISKLDVGTSILAIAYGKDFEAVYCDVREAYVSKYRR